MTATPAKIRTGFFIIADISGYTSFLTGTELVHAQEIIEDLTKLLLSHIVPPFKLVKLEGDAVFYYTHGDMLPEAERLLDHIEACYFDFVGHIDDMKRLTSCPCRACSAMQTLDLKFFVHYGDYMVQRVPGTAEDIVGPAVILLHRLLKNSVTEQMALRGYALLTKACLERMGEISSIRPHIETYEHIGEVRCGVYDLRSAEQKMRETRRVYLKPEEADYIYERIVPTSPDIMWSFIVDPQRRVEWQVINTVENTRNDSGRMGIDAEFHCHHGAFSRMTRMQDWRPFQYMTNITIQTFHKTRFKSPPFLVTFELTPIDAQRTKLSFRMRSLRRDWFTLQFIRFFMKRSFDKENNFEYDRLDKVLTGLNSHAKEA